MSQPKATKFERKALLERFRGMVERREPIVGGGAGTGLSARCEEAGGIDLIVIYNSGRYRMAGRGSLAGMLAYGNANDIVLEMAQEVLDNAMQTFGAMGMTKELPLQLMAQQVRVQRIYEGPSEVHRMAIAKRILKERG